jgi:hypothetical protein
MSKTKYTINHTSSSFPDIILSSSVLDSTSLPIKLVGPSYIPKTTDDLSWGEVIQENSLRMLENFNSNVEPTNAPDGMLWYDSSNKTLKIRYNNGTSSAWSNVTVAGSLPPGASPITVTSNTAYINDQPLVLPKNTNIDASITSDDDYAATRGYVKSVVQDPGSATPQIYGSAAKDDSSTGKNNVHYYMLPGNVMMVWGNALGKFRPTQVRGRTPLAGTGGATANIGPVNYFADATLGEATTTLAAAESNIIGATITFADYGIPDFNDTSYSVTVTEAVPKVSATIGYNYPFLPNFYDETTGFLRRTCPQNWAGYNKVPLTDVVNTKNLVGTGNATSATDNRMKTYEAIPPMVFIVYDKKPTGFKIHATTANVAADKVLYSSWSRYFADCNFSIIGHKKP